MGVPNSVLIKDVKIFTGTEIVDEGYVFVLDGKIAEVGKGKFNGDLSTGITVISRPGDSLIPGLIDAHVHALSGNVNSIEQSLRFGVTTVCDMHNDPRDNAELKKLASAPANKSKYADFKCAGLGAVIEGGWPIPVMKKEFADQPCGDHLVDKIVSTWPMLRKPEDAEPFVKQQIKENGAAYIKMFHELGDTLGMDLPRPPMDIQKAVVAAAHKHGVITTGHAFSYAGAMDLLRAGADGLSHMFLDEPPSDDYIQLLLDNGAHCNPTLGLCASQTDEGQEVQQSFLQDPFAQKMLIQKAPTKPLGLAAGQKPRASIANAYANTKALYKAGVPLIVGTDAAGKGFGLPYGLGMHMEMRALVKEFYSTATMASKQSPHVLIVGAGLSGLTLGQILRKNNISFSIFERDTRADARAQGWAIALHGPVLAELSASMPADLGPIEQTNHLSPLDHIPAQFVFYDASKPDWRAGVTDDDTGKIVRANRQRLRDWLLQFLPVQFNKRVTRIEERDAKVTAYFEDGSSETGDILVGAEGSRSLVRKHILQGQDVIKPLPVGSLVGEIQLSGEDLVHQLELGHSAYIVLDSSPENQRGSQASLFAALNKISPDKKTGYFYFILHWIDRAAAESTEERPFWTVTASREELMAFAKEKTKIYPDYLRVLVDKVPVESYRQPGIVLQSVELAADQLPAGRITLAGDSAHSMTPFRGEAGVCALTDGLRLGRAIASIRDAGGADADVIKYITEYRDDMLARGAKAISVSNPVLEQHAKDANYEFWTCGKKISPLPKEKIVV
ncbi:hypothetical protein CkaCkLH20_03030 [Colletotrichum karsti]|uniref:Amidohydrolase-related domain-containing protein n=1 Tax=Colletotrichum karsti TaxID=1095194 RepID=A0A9P6IBU4_9PEZI|nr:uncharacterized protein CkaCkLH20_03030 [Colletotrichum karsti]KAF9879487.1 hypothetical protein CkaCkLH20_03030 [Colletotrichum karsti]